MSKYVKSMSLVEVVCDVSSITVIFGPVPSLEVFRQHFGMEGPLQLFTAYVTLPYHPLEIVELGVEHSGGRPRGGIGAAAHFESSEARLMSVRGLYLLITWSRTD